MKPGALVKPKMVAPYSELIAHESIGLWTLQSGELGDRSYTSITNPRTGRLEGGRLGVLVAVLSRPGADQLLFILSGDGSFGWCWSRYVEEVK